MTAIQNYLQEMIKYIDKNSPPGAGPAAGTSDAGANSLKLKDKEDIARK